MNKNISRSTVIVILSGLCSMSPQCELGEIYWSFLFMNLLIFNTSLQCITVLMHEGNLVNGRGRDNAQAEGECIIHLRLLSATPDPKQPLIFEDNAY